MPSALDCRLCPDFLICSGYNSALSARGYPKIKGLQIVSPAPEKFQFATRLISSSTSLFMAQSKYSSFSLDRRSRVSKWFLPHYQVYQLPVPAQVKGRQPVGPAGQAFQLPVGAQIERCQLVLVALQNTKRCEIRYPPPGIQYPGDCRP
jgi:hypothetical protein